MPQLFEIQQNGVNEIGDILAVRGEYRQIQWGGGNSGVQASGLMNKKYCIQQRLSEKSLHYWQKKLRIQIVATVRELVPPELVSAVDEGTSNPVS